MRNKQCLCGIYDDIRTTAKIVASYDYSALSRLKRSVYYSCFTVCLAHQVGTHGPSVGHRQNKRRALIARAVCTECPNVGQFLGTSYRSAALPLCMMPHDYLVVIEWRFLWYFYDTSCKIIQNVSFFYLIMYQLFVSVFSQQDDTLILFT